MSQLVYGQDHVIIPWVCNQLKMQIPKDSVSLGIVSNNQIVGGALYHNYNITFDNRPLFIEMSFATIDKRWGSRAIISALLGYPFLQLKVKRVQSTVSKRNREVRLFLERLGFSLEGVGRLAWPHGGDAMMYSLLSREFFSSKWFKSGKIGTISPGSARSERHIGGANSQQQSDGALQLRA